MSVRCQISWPIGFLVEEIRARSPVLPDPCQTLQKLFLTSCHVDSKNILDNYISLIRLFFEDGIAGNEGR